MPITKRGTKLNISKCMMLNIAAVIIMAICLLPIHRKNVCWMTPLNKNSSHTAGIRAITNKLLANTPIPPKTSVFLMSIFTPLCLYVLLKISYGLNYKLYHKAKAEGLTDEEAKEQKELRSEYRRIFRSNLMNQISNIRVVKSVEENFKRHLKNKSKSAILYRNNLKYFGGILYE